LFPLLRDPALPSLIPGCTDSCVAGVAEVSKPAHARSARSQARPVRSNRRRGLSPTHPIISAAPTPLETINPGRLVVPTVRHGAPAAHAHAARFHGPITGASGGSRDPAGHLTSALAKFKKERRGLKVGAPHSPCSCWCSGRWKGNSNSHRARPVHLIITTIKWIRTSRLSIKNSLRQMEDGRLDVIASQTGSRSLPQVLLVQRVIY